MHLRNYIFHFNYIVKSMVPTLPVCVNFSAHFDSTIFYLPTVPLPLFALNTNSLVAIDENSKACTFKITMFYVKHISLRNFSLPLCRCGVTLRTAAFPKLT